MRFSKAQGKVQQCIVGLGLSAMAMIAACETPVLAGPPRLEPDLDPKFDPLHRLRPSHQRVTPRVNFGYTDAWVAKYSPDGSLLWKKQLGTSSYDYSFGVATDSSGNVLISGMTLGALGGAHQGIGDAWVAKYGPNGVLLWKQQLGTSNTDYSQGVATDSSGNVLISGYTYGNLGGARRGNIDAWVAKYSPNGALLWKKQLGTSRYDYSFGVATDSSGNVLISGMTLGALGGANQGLSDAWVAKYSPDGALLWKKQLGTSRDDASSGVATDSSGNVLISGTTDGALGGANQGLSDAWVAKYKAGRNGGGTPLWKKQLGTSSYDHASDVATDSSGNVLISGTTLGGAAYLAGNWGVWVAKYSPDGVLLWKKQLGTSTNDDSSSVATDSSGNVLISGTTDGTLGGVVHEEYDAWVAKYSPDGVLLWKKQLGTSRDDFSYGVATDSSGNVLISGMTESNLSGD